MKKLMTICVVTCLVLAMGSAAQANWSDNFNGNTSQQTWATVNQGNNGSATFTNDRYELTSTGTAQTAGAVASYVSEDFTNCLVSGRIQQIASGDHFLSYLMGRVDPATMSGYVLGIGSVGGGDVPHLWIGKLTNGVYSEVASPVTQPEFDYTNCQAKFSLEGSTLRGKVWTYGTSEPDWQISATNTSYTSGSAGVMVATYPTLGWNSVQAAFDDVSVVPEPATIGLLLLGCFSFMFKRSRNRG